MLVIVCLLTLLPHLDTAAADPRETEPFLSEEDETYKTTGAAHDSYDCASCYIHEDITVDQAQMEELMGDHPIFC